MVIQGAMKDFSFLIIYNSINETKNSALAQVSYIGMNPGKKGSRGNIDPKPRKMGLPSCSLKRWEVQDLRALMSLQAQREQVG